MTENEYKQTESKLVEYRCLRASEFELQGILSGRDFIIPVLFHNLDDDLKDKLYSLAEDVINEQISRIEKKMEELQLLISKNKKELTHADGSHQRHFIQRTRNCWCFSNHNGVNLVYIRSLEPIV